MEEEQTGTIRVREGTACSREEKREGAVGKNRNFVPAGNELAKDLRGAGSMAQYDGQVKKVLGNKIILAWILHYTIAEFAGLAPEEIVPYIEGEPQVGTLPIHHGGILQNNAANAEGNGEVSVKESGADGNEGTTAESVSSARQVNMFLTGERTGRVPEKITGLANEDKEPGEGIVFYDIRFFAFLPGKSRKRVKIILDVEAQKSFYPGYKIESRGVFYCGRMISSQLGREFEEPNYDGIKKVYSVWLCMNAPDHIGNAIAKYQFSKTDIEPGMPDRREAYDKQSVIMVCLNEKRRTDNRLCGMLNVLLSATMGAGEKIEKLEKEYGITMSREMGKELKLMCNLSEWVLETGWKKGLSEGRQLESKSIAKRMLLSGSDDDQIIRFTRVSRVWLEEMKARIS